ncbi:hypothetical protein [Membranihabitans maritimus]|uniref:hypothetical protein n=1 Tax=Membranihabitans maritimus TaxID=2904244 RepID=UPI001F48942D|nr:hypothetical protein [Membranihabitans maritimus]
MKNMKYRLTGRNVKKEEGNNLSASVDLTALIPERNNKYRAYQSLIFARVPAPTGFCHSFTN